MLLFYGITLIVLSLVAVPSLILSKRPDAQKLLDKIVPYQGWAGVVFCICGLIGIVQSLFILGLLGTGFWGIIQWLTWFTCSLVEAVLGFILGYGLIARYAFKGDEAKAKSQAVLQKLLPWQKTVAIIGIVLGLWCITYSIIIYPMMLTAAAVS